jgi:anti-anti-sigma factor
MTIELQRGVTGLALQLSGSLTIYEARDMQAVLLEAFRQGTAMAADLSEVQEIDAAGLQLLVALARNCRNAGLSLQFDHPSPAVTEALRWSGLADELGLPEATP